MYEEVAGKKFDEFKLKEELWHYEIDKWAIYQFRKRRREIRDALRKEGLSDLCEKDKPRGPRSLQVAGPEGFEPNKVQVQRGEGNFDPNLPVHISRRLVRAHTQNGR
jgi:hypothetical protein